MARAKLKDLKARRGEKEVSCQNFRLLVPFHAALVCLYLYKRLELLGTLWLSRLTRLLIIPMRACEPYT